MIAPHRSDRGAALVVSLFLMLMMSVLAGSLMFLSQTETYASMNYRLMSQARYAAEAGLQSAVNYLTGSSYAVPTTASMAMGNVSGKFDISTSPVRFGGSPVTLSSSATSSNYPDSATRTAFAAAASGTISAGATTMTYSASATLLSMRQINVYGSTTPATVQTWEVTSTGAINAGSRTAQVQVTGTLERQVGPAFQYAAFAVYNGCDAIDFSGLAATNSYDSTSPLQGGAPVLANWGGNVGTNGNLTANGTNATINGSLSTPRTGNGACGANNVTAETLNGGQVTGGVITLPQPVPAPTPAPPSPMPPTTQMRFDSNCNDYSGPGCSVVNGHVTFRPNGSVILLGDVRLNASSSELHLNAGTYNINSMTANGSSKIVIDSGPVILNVAGTGFSGTQTVINFAGQMASNSTYDPTQLQIIYGGTATIQGAGGSDNAALVYAPNATVKLTGGSDWYGAVVGQYVTINGGAALHYDRHLQKAQLALGNWALSSFSWKKF